MLIDMKEKKHKALEPMKQPRRQVILFVTSLSPRHFFAELKVIYFVKYWGPLKAPPTNPQTHTFSVL